MDLNDVFFFLHNFLAFEIFDEKRSISSPPPPSSSSTNPRKTTNYSQDESSISEDISIHRKDIETLVRKYLRSLLIQS